MGKRRVANVRKLRGLLDDYSVNHSGGIRGFIEYYRSLKAWGVPEEEAEQVTEERNVMRFLTIHGAKGLEFPVVVLANTGAQLGGGPDPKVLVSADLEAGFPSDDADSGASIRKRLISAAASEAELEEERRLIYVAMTRTRDRLIVAGTATQKNLSNPDSSYLSMIAHHVAEDDPLDGLADLTVLGFGNSQVLVRRNPGI